MLHFKFFLFKLSLNSLQTDWLAEKPVQHRPQSVVIQGFHLKMPQLYSPGSALSRNTLVSNIKSTGALGLHCLSKEQGIIHRATAIDRHLIRQIIWVEISRTFSKLFLYMNQGRLHKKTPAIKRGQGFGFRTAPWAGVSAEWCRALLGAAPNPRWSRGKSATCWGPAILPASVLSSSLSVCPHPPSSARVIPQIAPGYHVPSINRASCCAEVGERREKTFSLGT